MKALVSVPRPRFLDFTRIRFPVGAVASIAHRISGVVLVAALPLGVLLLERSLQADDAFPSLLRKAQSMPGRIALLVIAWAAAQHLFAGIRHLLMDVGIGSSLSAGRASAEGELAAWTAIIVATHAL
jgi:succinate dehydrogenase / fumarate reductase cytochrome b subunit